MHRTLLRAILFSSLASACVTIENEVDLVDVPVQRSDEFIVGSWTRTAGQRSETATFHADGRFEYASTEEGWWGYLAIPPEGRWSATPQELTIVYGPNDCCKMEMTYFADETGLFPGAYILEEHERIEESDIRERQTWFSKLRHETLTGTSPFTLSFEPTLEFENNWWGKGELFYDASVSGTFNGRPVISTLDRGSYALVDGEPVLDSSFYQPHTADRLEVIADGVMTWAERNVFNPGFDVPNIFWDTGFEFSRVSTE